MFLNGTNEGIPTGRAAVPGRRHCIRQRTRLVVRGRAAVPGRRNAATHIVATGARGRAPSQKGRRT